jgi:iron(III) transport system ATP-binding protein
MAMSDRIMVLNRGIIQQVAHPTEIYRRPANQFVSDFVGKVNFLKGTVTDKRIDLSGIGQSIPYEGPYAGKVIVAIRPENIAISAGTGGRTGGDEISLGILEGKLTSMFYLGDINDCRVDINGEAVRVIAESGSFDTLKEGQKISLELREFLVYEDSGEDESARIIT